MKKTLMKTLAVLTFCAAISTLTHAQPLTLSGTNYFQNFDNIGSGLPGEWLVYTNAKSTQLGTLLTLASSDPAAAINGCASTSFGFKNLASITNTVGGTNFLGTEALTNQAVTLNRVLGVRPTGGSDPGCAFVLKIADATGFGKFKLNLDFLLLNPQTRSNYWAVDFGVSPDGFSPPSSFTVVTTNAYFAFGTFGSTNVTVDFGTLLDNQPGPIWVRIVNLAFSQGGGSRPTVGIDNFSLSFTNIPVGVVPVAVTSGIGTNNVFTGDSVTLSVGVSGTAPFSYQWYYPDLNSTIGGANAASYAQTLITPSQAWNYYVIVSNNGGLSSVTNKGVLNVTTRIPISTTIAYLRTLQDLVNYAPYDTTNLYTVVGTVISRTNMTTPANASFWIEDTNSLAGIDVFVAGSTDLRPNVGDRIQVTGPLGIYSGVLELNLNSLNPTHVVTSLGSGFPLPVAKTFLFSSATNVSLMESNIEGSLVIVPDVYLPGGGVSNFISSSTLQMTNLSGQIFPLFIDSRLTDVIGQPIPAGLTAITGYMTQYKTAAPYTNGYELIVTAYSQIQPGLPLGSPTLNIQLSGANVVLTWSDASFNLQSATNVAGPYTMISGATSPFTTNTAASQLFFRLSNP